MGFITRYGSFWGSIPETSGRIFWVGPSATYTVEGRSYTASDNNDGLSPERALLTLDYAVGLCTANVGDVIVMLPGAHSYSSAVAADVAGITITGIPNTNTRDNPHMPMGGKRRVATVVNTASAAVTSAIITVTAADVEIANLTFLPVAAGGQGIQVRDGCARCYIHDCTFAMVATASVTTYGIHAPLASALTTCEDVLISHCYFVSGTAGGSGANGAGVAALGTVYNMVIENSTFELKGAIAAWADAIKSDGTATFGLIIRDVDFVASASPTALITECIDISGGQVLDGSATALRCYFPLHSVGLQATSALDMLSAECYIANSAGGVLLAVT
jgi:hypothetical protein